MKATLLPELKEVETPLEQRSKPLKKPVKKKRLDEFTEAEREQIALWCGILKEWQAARSKFKCKTEADPLFCGKIKLEHPDIDISVDILYRKYKAYRNNDFQGLVENRGGWNRGKCSIDDTVWSIFTSYYLTTHQHRISVTKYFPTIGDISALKTLLYVITMYVSDGLIPVFLVYKALGLTNSFAVYILPDMVSASIMEHAGGMVTSTSVRTAATVITSLPIICLYPFL